MSKPIPPEDFLISLSDIVAIIKRNRKHIQAFVFVFAIIGFIFTVSKPLKYTARGTFKEKGKTESNKKTLSPLLGNTSSAEADALTIFKSRNISEQVVKKLGLQAKLEDKNVFLYPLKNIYLNLRTELVFFLGRKFPITAYQPTLLIREVNYFQDTPEQIQIVFTTDTTYDVLDRKNKIIASGILGSPTTTTNATFTLLPVTGITPSKKYKITLLPMYLALDIFSAQLAIEEDKIDKSLIKIFFTDENSQQANLIVDEIMQVYQDYLLREDEKFATKQVEYLNKRSSDMFEKQSKLMKEYADSLSNDLSQTGYATSENEMEFLAKIHHEYKEQLLKIELATKYLEEMLQKDVQITKNQYGLDFTPIAQIIQQIEEMKHQRDSIAIALRQRILQDEEHLKMEFEHQITNLDRITQDTREVNQLIAQIENGEVVKKDVNIFSEPTLLVKSWMNQVDLAYEAYRDGPVASKPLLKQNWDSQKTSALSYLKNLEKLNEVHAQIIKERLSNHYDPKLEFQGIDIETARQLYYSYCKDVGILEAEIRQNIFIIKEIQDPDFELNSLSSLIKDPVVQEIITKSSVLALTKRDEEYRSNKEISRVKEEMDIQKKFVIAHLIQSTQMLELRKNLLEEKLYSLQGVTMELVHQRITILQKQIHDFIVAQVRNLEREKNLFGKRLAEVNQQMALLPNKWVSEQILNQNLNINKSIVEEITRLVESKNISNHLEMIKSSPLDAGFASPRPNYPKIAILTLGGGLFGALLAITFFVVQAMFAGVRASQKNLQYSGQYVAGSISTDCAEKPQTDVELETLRKIILRNKDCSPLLLLTGQGCDYSLSLAQLWKMKNTRNLLVFTSFNRVAEKEELPGLLQALQNNILSPKVCEKNGISYIAPGGISRYTLELLSTPKFKSILAEEQNSYDQLIIVNNSPLLSTEALFLLNLFDRVIVTITDEKLHDLHPYTSFTTTTNNKKLISFVVNETS